MAQRTSKRNTVHFGLAYHDRVPMEEDFESVQARTATRTAFNHTAADAGSYSVPSPWTIGSVWGPEESSNFSLDPNDEWYDEALDADIGDVMERIFIKIPCMKARRKRSQASVSRWIIFKQSLFLFTLQARPHVFWKENARNTYLDEMLRQEGRGDFSRDVDCPDCVSRGAAQVNTAEFRCRDCFLPDLTCAMCLIRRHRLNPFHTIDVSAIYFLRMFFGRLMYRGSAGMDLHFRELR